jgi:hypothetical protein
MRAFGAISKLPKSLNASWTRWETEWTYSWRGLSLTGKAGPVVSTCREKGTRTANYLRTLFVNVFVDTETILNALFSYLLHAPVFLMFIRICLNIFIQVLEQYFIWATTSYLYIPTCKNTVLFYPNLCNSCYWNGVVYNLRINKHSIQCWLYSLYTNTRETNPSG